MKIAKLIDRDVNSVSVLEDTRDLAAWLKERQYFAVIDEELHTAGIITINDIITDSARNVLDCNFVKPRVTSQQTIVQVFQIMQETGYDFLPVFDSDTFIGVISLIAITDRLVTILSNTKAEYQKAIHDLRNPVANIQGLINLLLENVKDVENSEILHIGNLSCKHALDILEDLIFVELDDSKPMTFLPTEMNDFYSQCVSQQIGLGLLKNITIDTNFDDQKITKNIDRSQLKRAIQNLISNAIKFSYPNNKILVNTTVSKDKIQLKITDYGVGIPQDMRDVVFDKFTTAQRPGTNGEGSTGLGLYFAKQCIESHGGIIIVNSVPNKKTEFHITL